jgi:nucleoside-diphosphate-sugar epimerase
MTEPLALAGDERILVTGASGWLGRSLLSRLLPSFPADRLLALGSRSRSLTVDGHPIEILAWDDVDVAGFAPTHLVHLAYLTRDRLAELGWSRYVAENVGLTARIVDLLALPSVRALVHTSSGAVAGLTESTAQPAREQPYGLLKRIDELLFADECARRGLACVTCRVWSVSGPHVVEPHKYAFSDLILQALSGSDLVVRSRSPVFRRYLDAGELMDVALRLALAGRSASFDSGGTRIEVGELASLILEELGAAGTRVTREMHEEGPVDDYSADDAGFLELAADTGVAITDIRGQIRHTAAGMRSASFESVREGIS